MERTETQLEVKKPLRTFKPIQSTNAILPKWSGKRVEVLITRQIGDTRILLKRKKVRTSKMMFYWGHRAFYVDPDKIFMFAKLPMLLYDVEYAEPLEGAKELVHMPEVPVLNPHFSVKVERILKQDAIRQGLNAIRDTGNQFNWLAIMLLLVGVVLGFFMGSSNLIPHAAVTTVSH